MNKLIAFFYMISVVHTSQLTLTAQTGIHFKEKLNKNAYFPSAVNVKFTVSLDGMPDLPQWMKLEQKDPFSDAFIYGTPSSSDVETIKLEVIAWNKDTYETARNEIIVTVLHLDTAAINYQLEFKIKNKNVADMFNVVPNFIQIVNQNWQSASYITVVDKPTHRKGGSYPIPGTKEGVFIAVGGRVQAPDELTKLKSMCLSVPSSSTIQKTFSDAGFDIDWCSLKVIILSETGKSKDTNNIPFKQSDAFEPATLNSRYYSKVRANHTLDVVFVFIPVTIGIALIVLLTCVMCFNRKRTEKTASLTPNKQLQQHRSLRRASAHVRDMSNNANENHHSNGFAYGQLQEDSPDSRSDTPNRVHSAVKDPELGTRPPVYRIPPDLNEKTKDSKF